MLTQWNSRLRSLARTLRHHTPTRPGLAVALAIMALVAVVRLPSVPAQSPSPLTISPSTGNVGIGTQNPGETLSVFGNFSARASYTNYTGDGLFDANAAPSYILTPGGTKLLLGYSDFGGGQYAPRIGFLSNGGGLNTKASIGIEPGYGDMTLNGGTNNTEYMRIKSNGRVGIGTWNPQATFDVVGTISASVKQFRIPHPLAPDKQVLVHSSLEGPEVGVYYRGEVQLQAGQAEVILPAYFEALTLKDQRTVQLTPLDGWSPLYVVGGVQGGRFLVRTGEGGNPAQRFYWEVKAVRSDVARLVVEREKPAEMPPTRTLTPPKP